MATPLSATTALAALRKEGCKVVEYKDWRTHNRNHIGAWGPVHGVMIHHTVTSGTSGSVALCYTGRSDLPGPLCHTVGAKDGQLYMVGWGRCNHAGSGDDDVLRAVINETTLPVDNEANTDGNARFYGIELINLGDGKDPWPEVQVDAAARWAAALCRAHGWSARSVIGHKEWQPGKIDPTFDMNAFRTRVAGLLAHEPGWSPQQEEDPMAGMTNTEIARAVWETDGVVGVPTEWSSTNPEWKPASILIDVGKRVRALNAKLDAQNTAITELAKTVSALAANTAAIDPDALVARIQGAIESVTVRLDVPNA